MCNHRLVHKNDSEVQTFTCNKCSYIITFKEYLQDQILIHKKLEKMKTFKMFKLFGNTLVGSQNANGCAKQIFSNIASRQHIHIKSFKDLIKLDMMMNNNVKNVSSRLGGNVP